MQDAGLLAGWQCSEHLFFWVPEQRVPCDLAWRDWRWCRQIPDIVPELLLGSWDGDLRAEAIVRTLVLTQMGQRVWGKSSSLLRGMFPQRLIVWECWNVRGEGPQRSFHSKLFLPLSPSATTPGGAPTAWSHLLSHEAVMKGRNGNKELHRALRAEQTGGGSFNEKMFGPLTGEAPRRSRL